MYYLSYANIFYVSKFTFDKKEGSGDTDVDRCMSFRDSAK